MSVTGAIGTVAAVSFRTSLQGIRALALAAFAAVPSLILVALVAAHGSPDVLRDASQSLFLGLTMPVVGIVLILLLAVGQFRNEIDDDTLTYLSSRSIPRWGIVLGKYLGCVGAVALYLVPAGLAPVAIARLAGAAALPSGAIAAIVAIALLAALAYSAVFLLFGLVTSWALFVGLVYGFLWEELLLQLPGSAPKLTIAYYLKSLGSDLVSSGPFSGMNPAAATDQAVAGPIFAAVLFVALAMLAIRFVELVPRRTSA